MGVITWAVLLITSKLIKIYAFDAFSRGSQPAKEMVDAYLNGSSHGKPLDFYNFPRLIKDFSVIKKKVIGSPMYGPSAMIRAILAIGAIRASMDGRVPQTLLSERPARLEEVLLAAYRGEDSARLLKMTE